MAMDDSTPPPSGGAKPSGAASPRGAAIPRGAGWVCSPEAAKALRSIRPESSFVDLLSVIAAGAGGLLGDEAVNAAREKRTLDSLRVPVARTGQKVIAGYMVVPEAPAEELYR